MLFTRAHSFLISNNFKPQNPQISFLTNFQPTLHLLQQSILDLPAELFRRSQMPDSVIHSKTRIDHECVALPSQSDIFSEKLNKLDILSLPR